MSDTSRKAFKKADRKVKNTGAPSVRPPHTQRGNYPGRFYEGRQWGAPGADYRGAPTRPHHDARPHRAEFVPIRTNVDANRPRTAQDERSQKETERTVKRLQNHKNWAFDMDDFSDEEEECRYDSYRSYSEACQRGRQSVPRGGDGAGPAQEVQAAQPSGQNVQETSPVTDQGTPAHQVQNVAANPSRATVQETSPVTDQGTPAQQVQNVAAHPSGATVQETAPVTGTPAQAAEQPAGKPQRDRFARRQLDRAKSELQKQVELNSSLEQTVEQLEDIIAAMTVSQLQDRSNYDSDRKGLEEALRSSQAQLEHQISINQTLQDGLKVTHASTQELEAECRELRTELQKQLETNKMLEQRCQHQDRSQSAARADLEALKQSFAELQQKQHDSQVKERDQNENIAKLRGDLETALRSNAELQNDVAREKKEKDILKKSVEDAKLISEEQHQTVQTLQKELAEAQCTERNLQKIQKDLQVQVQRNKSQQSKIGKLKEQVSNNEMIIADLRQLESDYKRNFQILNKEKREVEKSLKLERAVHKDTAQQLGETKVALEKTEQQLQKAKDEHQVSVDQMKSDLRREKAEREVAQKELTEAKASIDQLRDSEKAQGQETLLLKEKVSAQTDQLEQWTGTWRDLKANVEKERAAYTEAIKQSTVKYEAVVSEKEALSQAAADQREAMRRLQEQVKEQALALAAAEEQNRELQQERAGLQTALRDKETHINEIQDEFLKLQEETQKKKKWWRFWRRN